MTSGQFNDLVVYGYFSNAVMVIYKFGIEEIMRNPGKNLIRVS